MSLPLFAQDHSIKKCGGLETLTPTTTLRKCGVQVMGGQKCYIMKGNLEI